MLQVLPEGFTPKESLNLEKYNLDWYQEHRLDVGVMTPLFTREHIDVFYDLVEQSKSEVIPVNSVLDFINPMFRGQIGDIGPIDTLGYFLNDLAWNRAKQYLTDEERDAYWRDIDEKRLNILGAVGAKDPYVWTKDRVLYAKVSLGTGSGSVDLVEDYVNSVNKLFDALEQTYNLEEVYAILVYRKAEFQYMLDNKIGRSGGVWSEEYKNYLEKRINRLQKGIDRLRDK